MTEQSFRNYVIKRLRSLADKIEKGQYTAYTKSHKINFGPKRILDMAQFLLDYQIIPTFKKLKK
jgi:hypothetical protein